MATNSLTVKIFTPIQVIYDGEALSVSSTNSTGKFDILPFHANFITLVQKQPIILRVRKKGYEEKPLHIKAFDEFFSKDVNELKYEFETAIILTKDNIVKIYTNIQLQF